MPEEDKKVVSVSEFRALIGQERKITLPESQARVKVKRLTPMDYIKRGLTDIPNEFFKFISEISTGGIEGADEEQMKKNCELFEKFLTITVENGVVEPPMLLKYDKEKEESHLLFGEFSMEDQKYLVDVISGRIDG